MKEYLDKEGFDAFVDKIKTKTSPATTQTAGVMTAEDKTKLDNLQSAVFGDVKAVDLGLPSGTLWADRNVGASSPEDGGMYFQWGDTQGYTADQVGTGEGQKRFSDISYKFYDSQDTANRNMTKYNQTDGKTTLDLEDDAAHHILGSNWKIPTEKDFIELATNTDITVERQDGVIISGKANSNGVITWSQYVGQWKTLKGFRFTNKSDITKSIFIPAAGYASGGSVFKGYQSRLRLSTLKENDYTTAKDIYLAYDEGRVLQTDRHGGEPIRGVTTSSPKSLISNHIQDTNNPHKVTKEQVGLSNVTNDAQVKRSEMGVDNGVATLNSRGKLVLEQLPDEVSNYIKDLQDESKTLLRWLNFGKSTINPIIAQAHFTDPDQAFFRDQNDTKIIIPVDENGDVTNYVVPSGTTRMRFEGNTALESIKIYGVQALTNIHCMFDSCSNLKYVNTADWDVSNVTDSEAPFWHTSSLIEADLSNWNLAKSTNLAQFMQDIPALTTLKLDNFNTCGTGVEINCGDVFYYLPIKEFIAPNWTNFKYLSQKFSIISNMPNLERVVLHSIDTSAECNSKYTSVTHFKDCPKLKKIEVTDSINITKDYDLSQTIVDRNTALLFLQGLNSGVTGKMIKFSPESFSKLTDADKKIATDKGWRVVVVAPVQ